MYVMRRPAGTWERYSCYYSMAKACAARTAPCRDTGSLPKRPCYSIWVARYRELAEKTDQSKRAALWSHVYWQLNPLSHGSLALVVTIAIISIRHSE